MAGEDFDVEALLEAAYHKGGEEEVRTRQVVVTFCARDT